MKIQLLAATALVSALLLSAPVHATAPAKGSNHIAYSAVVDLQAGYRHMTEDDDDVSDGQFTYGGNGRVSFPFGDMFSAQADAKGEWFHDVSDANSHTPTSNALLGGHLSARDPNHGLLGVFAATGFPSQKARADSPVDAHSLKWEGGLEGQVYLNDFTFYGQVGYANMEEDKGQQEGFTDGRFYRGVVRYFINDDTMVNAEYSRGSSNHYIDDTGDDGDFKNWGVGGAMRLPFTSFSQPLYGTLEYQSGRYHTDDGPDKARDHALLAGVKIMFGESNSLKHNDRYGATLDLPMLPVRATSWTESLD